MTKQITASPELYGALVANFTDSAHDKFTANPSEFLGIENIDIKLVNNSAKEMNLALPFYSGVTNPPAAMSDADLHVASGGISLIGQFQMNSDAVRSSYSSSAYVSSGMDTVSKIQKTDRMATTDSTHNDSVMREDMQNK